jgi:hypothetical protein
MNKTIVYRTGIVVAVVTALASFAAAGVSAQVTPPPQNPQSGSVGMQGTITVPPPDRGATIAIPSNGQNFSQIPITVSGICPTGLLVKLFKNNIFSGSAECVNGSYSIQTDLFIGENELVVRVYDALDQEGPPSNRVTVTYSDNRPGAATRPTLTSNFAKRGANPGDTLRWPIILSGGEGPYAISIDWGDGSQPDLLSLPFPGPFDIEHIYDSPGVYNIVIKATDRNGNSAFLQLVGVANGPLGQSGIGDGSGEEGSESGGQSRQDAQARILWQPAAILVPFIGVTFWLGRRHELKSIKRRIERGERPF